MAIAHRPAQGAAAIGISLREFWRQAKIDPDFPPLIHLSPRCTLVRDEDLRAYIERKASKVQKSAETLAVPA